MRPSGGYFFEDYLLGQKFVHPVPRTLTQGDVALYQALSGSRAALHCSEPFAQALGYPSMPVDDLLVFHMAFGKTVDDISYNAVANLGYADCRFLQPVFIGDTLRAETEIIGLKENSSGKTGVVYVRSLALNQRGETVLTFVRWVMVNKREVNKRDLETKTSESLVPDFPAWVKADALSVPRYLREDRFPAADTGGARYWDDFVPQPGKVPKILESLIISPSGMTVDNSDHTLATKLYQNNARVHFDHLHMQDTRFGQRLIYGGHVISVCRALVHEGLENAMGILAINSGTHKAPTFAGDTLYAMAVATPLAPINKHWGALRILLNGFKNWIPKPSSGNSGEPAPPDSHVLTFDYTVLMPRRL